MSQSKATVAFLCAIPLAMLSACSHASGEAGLVEKMSKLQYFLHKTGLAVKAENNKLAGFYVHELEETIEELEDFGQYKSHEIGKLVKEILLPDFEILEKQVKQGQPAAQWKAYNAFIKSCNSCHKSTGHGFIVIEHNGENPFPQSFQK